MYNYKAIITEVVDGDTVTARVDLGFSIERTDRFRLYGINAPEMKLDTKTAGEASKARLIELLLNKEVFIYTHKDKREKYGRYLATIFIPDASGQYQSDIDSVNAIMVKEGHAKPYMV